MPVFWAQPAKHLYISLRHDQKSLVWCLVDSAHLSWGSFWMKALNLVRHFKVFLECSSSYRKLKSFPDSVLSGRPIYVWTSSLAASHYSNFWKWNMCPICTLCTGNSPAAIIPHNTPPEWLHDGSVALIANRGRKVAHKFLTTCISFLGLQ